MKARDRLILIAAVGKAQGLGGQMRLKFFGDDTAALRRYAHFYGADGRRFAVRSLQLHGGAPIVALQGVESREAAEALAGTELYVKRSQLADLAAEDEFYQADLLGFAAFAENGEPLGAVSGFFNFGGGDLLELTLPPRAEAEGAAAEQLRRQAAGENAPPMPAKLRCRQKRAAAPRKALIPFSKAAVPLVDMAASRLIINKSAAGLLPAENGAEEAENAAADKDAAGENAAQRG